MPDLAAAVVLEAYLHLWEQSALGELSSTKCQCVELAYFGGYTHTEIKNVGG